MKSHHLLTIDRPHRATVVVALSVVCSASASYSQNIATYTKQDLLELALQKSNAIKSMEVGVACDQTAGPTIQLFDGQYVPVAFVFSHRRVAFDENRFACEHDFAGDPAVSDICTTRWVAFNGVATSLYGASQESPMLGTLGIGTAAPDFEERTGLAAELTTWGIDYFDMQLLNPPMPGGSGDGDLSLISLLSAPTAAVRPVTETVNDRECHVIDLYDPSGMTNTLSMTAWIDTKCGGLPIHTDYFATDEAGVTELLVEFDVTQSAEVAPGVWLATDGWKKVYETRAVRDIDAREWAIHVDRDAHGALQLAVNIPLDDDEFELWKRVPAGTKCVIYETQESWIARADDVKEVVTEFLATANLSSESNLDTTSRFSLAGSPDSTPSYQASIAWTAAMVCSIAGAGACLVPWRKRRKPGEE